MINRARRLRSGPVIRDLVRETALSCNDFIYPLFLVEGENVRREIPSLPGVYHLSVDRLEEEARDILACGVRAVLLFGIPDHKDACGSEAYREDGVVQRGIRKLKECAPELYVITDVCMCEYTDHGHCGILDGAGGVDNDATLPYLARIALSHARAGADMVAPSDMMDGRVAALRRELDQGGFAHISIMAYSAKYASSFYGPFRDAAGSAPAFGDRRGYQMDCGNSREAMREIAQDIAEGADIVMVKPALMSMDVIRAARDRFDVPLAAYHVSGEYAMLYSAVKQGLLGEGAVYETLLSLKRAGAELIITYYAKDICRRLKGL